MGAEQGIRRGIPPNQLMAEAKRLIAEIEDANPHLKQPVEARTVIDRYGRDVRHVKCPTCTDDVYFLAQNANPPGTELVPAGVVAGLRQTIDDQLRTTANLTREIQRLNKRLEESRSEVVELKRRTVVPEQHIQTEPAWTKDMRDWSVDWGDRPPSQHTKEWMDQLVRDTYPKPNNWSPDEESWFTHFCDHPATRVVAFVAGLGFAIYLILR